MSSIQSYFGEMEKKKQQVISSIRIAKVYNSSKSTQMHTAETKPKKKCFKEKNELLGDKRCFCSVLCL